MESNSIINSITEMAAALMSPKEIAIMLDLNITDFEYQVKNKLDSDFAKAFNKGRLQTKFDLRKKVIQMAKAGSPQAEVLADKYLQSGV
jgi:hypothetical protein